MLLDEDNTNTIIGVNLVTIMSTDVKDAVVSLSIIGLGFFGLNFDGHFRFFVISEK